MMTIAQVRRAAAGLVRGRRAAGGRRPSRAAQAAGAGQPAISAAHGAARVPDVRAEDPGDGDRPRHRAAVEPAPAARWRLSRERSADRPGAGPPQGQARSEAADRPPGDAHQPHDRHARHGDAPEVRREQARSTSPTTSRSTSNDTRWRSRAGATTGTGFANVQELYAGNPVQTGGSHITFANDGLHLHHGRRRRPSAGRAVAPTPFTARCCA